MKLFLLFLLSISVCQPLFARNIVLLTSLPLKDRKLEPKIQRIFTKKTQDFSQDYAIVVKHKVDQEGLFQVLNDSETHAVFWVSHGAYMRANTSAAIKPAPMLLDHQGDNVAKVFQKVHSNVKFIAVIGCNSRQILEDVVKTRKDLDTFIPAKKVIGQFSLRKAIKHFRHTHHRKDNTPKPWSPPQGQVVTMTRKTGQGKFKSLKVFVGGELVTVLPKMEAQSTQQFQFIIPLRESYSKASLKVVVDSGQNPLDETNFIGQISLELDGTSPWRLFSKSDGRPFGTNERIFIFNGTFPL